MPLEIYDEAILRRAFHHAATFLRELPERPVSPLATREELMRAFDVPLTEEGEDDSAVLDALAAQATRGTMATAGPRFFGFVIGGSLPVTVATDWMLSAWDQNTGIYAASPIVACIEEIAKDWLLDLLNLPTQSSAGFTTGGQMSEFTCLAAARHAVLRDAGWNVEENGVNGAPKINVVLSAEAHITIYISLRYLGLGTRAIIVPTDEQGRMRAEDLRKTLATLSGPTIVCAQAGNVNTGSFDPLREIAEACRERKAWLHVDGAFGLWAAASRRKRHLVEGADLADSWAIDAHKWLNVPYDCGVAIVKDSAAHRASMTASAAYLVQTSGKERDSVDWVPEFSRRARGVTVYTALRTLGRLGVEDLVDRLCDRAKQIAQLLSRDDRVQIVNDVVLNQVLVRFGDDERTRETIARVQQDGTCWLGGTQWKNNSAMRISISSWATTEEDIERSAEAILRSIPR